MNNNYFMKTKPILPLILSMSMPMVVSMLVNSLYNIVDSFFVAKISKNAMTSLSLVFPVQNFINSIAVGFGVGINATISYFLGAKKRKQADNAAANGLIQGMRPIIGYNYGADEKKRVKQIPHTTLALNSTIMIFGTIICLIIPDRLISLFATSINTIHAGKTALRIICLGFIVSTISVTASGALEGLGMGIQSLMISLLRYVIIIIPAAFILSRIIGVYGVWNSFWIAEVITAIFSYAMVRKIFKHMP